MPVAILTQRSCKLLLRCHFSCNLYFGTDYFAFIYSCRFSSFGRKSCACV